MSLTIILSLVAIFISIVTIIMNVSNMKKYNQIKDLVPKKLYMELKVNGLYKANLLFYSCYPLVKLGLLDANKVADKAVSFIDIEAKYKGVID